MTRFLIPDQIVTERLSLRTFQEGDWEGLHALYSDPDCTRYTIQKTLTDAESWRVMASFIGHWHIRGYGPYCVVENASNKVIGGIGLWYPLEWPEPEIKWALSRAYWGKGYAKEAALAVKQMAKTHLPDTSLISLILPDNVNSIKLAESIGATYEKQIDFRGGVANIYRHA